MYGCGVGSDINTKFYEVPSVCAEITNTQTHSHTHGDDDAIRSCFVRKNGLKNENLRSFRFFFGGGGACSPRTEP